MVLYHWMNYFYGRMTPVFEIFDSFLYLHNRIPVSIFIYRNRHF